MLGGLRVAARAAPRLRGARLLSSGSHSDFETVRAAVPDSPAGVKAMIQEQVDGNNVMLYMKGTPARPQCGFSQQVCRILHATGVEFASVNVLEDDALREGIKEFSEWPTIPQLYVGGERVAPRRVVSFLEIARACTARGRRFLGGCDIVTEAFQSGELDEAFKSAGAK